MSKRRSDEKPRHLYLVLDDWSQGCSIRKIKLSHEEIHPPLITADVALGDVFTGRYTLPSALFRFEARRGEPKSIVGAFDHKILASTYGKSLVNGVLIVDIHTRAFIVGSWPMQDVFNPIYIPIDGRLFTLGGGSFDMLYVPPTYDDANWKNFSWSCFNLPKPTFQCDLVTSYAVHPDERTIFVSSVEQSGGPATFSFKTVEPMMWRRHGPWQLPFTGRGYFDPKLDAWVGLSGDLNTVGHICSCDVVSTDAVASHNQCPALKISKEKLFSMVPAERHIGATLVYMGGESRFCLLEGIHIEDDLADQSTDSDETNEVSVDEVNEIDFDDSNEMNDEESVDEVGEELDLKRFLRLTTFSLQYDRNGALKTGNSRRVWYYSMPLEVTEAMLKYPVAFWM